MNFFKSCLILFSFLIFSCNESTDSHSETETMHRYMAEDFDTTAVNNENPYDQTGQIHNELLYDYYQGENLPQTLTGIIGRTTNIANQSESFMALVHGKPYTFMASDRVAYIVSDSESCTAEIINTALETEAAKLSLKSFLTSFFTLCNSEEEYQAVYSFVTVYERDVLDNSSFALEDKKIILIATSIARHSAYAKKRKPKRNTDPDWIGLVANVVGAIDGANENEGEAIMRALASGIAENK